MAFKVQEKKAVDNKLYGIIKRRKGGKGPATLAQVVDGQRSQDDRTGKMRNMVAWRRQRQRRNPSLSATWGKAPGRARRTQGGLRSVDKIQCVVQCASATGSSTACIIGSFRVPPSSGRSIHSDRYSKIHFIPLHCKLWPLLPTRFVRLKLGPIFLSSFRHPFFPSLPTSLETEQRAKVGMRRWLFGACLCTSVSTGQAVRFSLPRRSSFSQQSILENSGWPCVLQSAMVTLLQ